MFGAQGFSPPYPVKTVEIVQIGRVFGCSAWAPWYDRRDRSLGCRWGLDPTGHPYPTLDPAERGLPASVWEPPPVHVTDVQKADGSRCPATPRVPRPPGHGRQAPAPP